MNLTKIKYELALDDFFVFSNYLLKSSPLLLKKIRKGQMWWASGPLVAGLILSILNGYSPEKSLITMAILSVAISLPMFFMYKHYYRHCNTKQINNLYKNGNYKEVLGTHEMTISHEYLTEKTEYHKTEIKWGLISKIDTTPSHTFIFTDEVTAYIIPHNKIIDGNAAQFIDMLNNFFKNRNLDLE